jgi:hypothetical protein
MVGGGRTAAAGGAAVEVGIKVARGRAKGRQTALLQRALLLQLRDLLVQVLVCFFNII